ncbi:MAG TPA: gas vesicle protein GvpJ [Candidatus Angelobacter sp.]
MHLSTEFATDTDLLDRVMDKGIVVEVWDRLGPGGIDLTGMQIRVSVLQLFARGKNVVFEPTYFLRVEPS